MTASNSSSTARRGHRLCAAISSARGHPRVHAVVADRLEQFVELTLVLAAPHLAEEGRAERARAVALDRDDRLAGEVSAHDQRVDAIEPSGAEELTPALVRAVDVGGVVEREGLILGGGALLLAKQSQADPVSDKRLRRSYGILGSRALSRRRGRSIVENRRIELLIGQRDAEPLDGFGHRRWRERSRSIGPIASSSPSLSTVAGNASCVSVQLISPSASGHAATIASTTSATEQAAPAEVVNGR